MGAGRPERSTGGGEIRRLRLHRDGGAWTSSPTSEVVWPFLHPADDGRGGVFSDIRMLCLNGIVRLRDGTLLMPVAGRSTVPEPGGAFWRLDRSWVLRSRDGGATWPESVFLAGGPSLCLCEPTIVETARAGELVAYLRSQYDTGSELYRSDSFDAGRTWSAPRGTGLPNTSGFGTKPYLARLAEDEYGLLQTYEHDRSDRTNIALFVTDEAGLREERWSTVKLLAAECRAHWLGSGYGWLQADPTDGAVHAVWVSFTPSHNHVNYARLPRHWLRGPAVEPHAVSDAVADDLPYVEDGSMRFPSSRSRAHAPRFTELGPQPWLVECRFRLERPPQHASFPLLDVRCRYGHDPWLALELRPDPANPASRTVWVHANTGWVDTRIGDADGQLEPRGDHPR